MESNREFRSGCSLPRIVHLYRSFSTKNEGKAVTKFNQQPTAAGTKSKSCPGFFGRVVHDEVENRNCMDTQALEEYLKKTSVAIIQLQGMIYKAEESYHDDTHAHGNIYRGLEPLLDFKITSTTTGGTSSGVQQMQSGTIHAISGGSAPSSSTTKRRMASEERWFSASCGVTVIPPNLKFGTASKRGKTNPSTATTQHVHILGSSGALAKIVSNVHGIATVGLPSPLQQLQPESECSFSRYDNLIDEVTRTSLLLQSASHAANPSKINAKDISSFHAINKDVAKFSTKRENRGDYDAAQFDILSSRDKESSNISCILPKS